MSSSNIKLCDDYNLNWDQGPIKILEVIFTPEVFDICDLNYAIVKNKVEKMLSIWSKRKLILPSKVTVIKTLALSKCVHLFLALPNPPDHMIKSLEKKFYKFIWSNGPD